MFFLWGVGGWGSTFFQQVVNLRICVGVRRSKRMVVTQRYGQSFLGDCLYLITAIHIRASAGKLPEDTDCVWVGLFCSILLIKGDIENPASPPPPPPPPPP